MAVQVLALAIGLTALLPILGYMFGDPEFPRIGKDHADFPPQRLRFPAAVRRHARGDCQGGLLHGERRRVLGLVAGFAFSMLFVSGLAIRHGFEANTLSNTRMARSYDLMLALAEMEAGLARARTPENAPANDRRWRGVRASRKSLASELQAEQKSSALREQISRLCLGFTALIALALLVLRRRPAAARSRASAPLRGRGRGRARRGRGGDARQERLPRQHEPRDPHADERHHRPVAPGAEDRADAAPARLPEEDPGLGPAPARDHQRHPRLLKIEAGKLSVEEIEFDLERVLDNLANLVSEKTTAKGLELVFDVGRDVPSSLVGDPLRLGQVLINYANNAVKFTEAGAVELIVSVLEQDEREVLLRFAVSDTGIGLSEEAKSRLFQSFQQADTSTSRKYGGSGLGLAISRKLANLMGGEVGVESELGGQHLLVHRAPQARQRRSPRRARRRPARSPRAGRGRPPARARGADGRCWPAWACKPRKPTAARRRSPRWTMPRPPAPPSTSSSSTGRCRAWTASSARAGCARGRWRARRTW
jgi:hypothetical protein